MNVTNDWSLIVEHTEASTIPGNLSTSYAEKAFLEFQESRSLELIDSRQCLSDFAKNRLNQFGFLTLIAEDFGLNSLEGIQKYSLIEKIILKKNDIADINLLKHLKNLYWVDLSFNSIRSIDSHCLNISVVVLNLSANHLSCFPDLSLFRHLRELDVSSNSLEKIVSTSVNMNLKVLKIQKNLISNFDECKEFSHLTSLDISFSNFNVFNESQKFPRLEQLIASSNNISDLSPIQNLLELTVLDLASNRIDDLGEVRNLQKLKYLRSLNLTDNVCLSLNFYLYLMIHTLPQLLILDGHEISVKDKTETEVFFGMDVESRKKIFENHLPQEQFVDYRIFKMDNVIVKKSVFKDFSAEEFQMYDFSV